MWNLIGIPTFGGLIWQVGNAYGVPDDDGICLSFHFSSFHTPFQRREVVRSVISLIKSDSLDWIRPGAIRWSINVDEMRRQFKGTPAYEWLRGWVSVVPELEQNEDSGLGHKEYNAYFRFYLTKDDIMQGVLGGVDLPTALYESVEQFRHDHPDPTKTAFLMMRFGKTPAHQAIVDGVRAALSEHGIRVVRADEKQYHDDLFQNVLTYIYGARFGIAVFERLEGDDFNPNVSLELGYMLALGKPVCLLKDFTLRTLHTDLVGKLYREFDPQNALESTKQPVLAWASDKGLITAL